MTGWVYNGRSRLQRDAAGRYVRSDGKRRRKTGKSGRAGSGAITTLSKSELAKKLVKLEDECALQLARIGRKPTPAGRTRDCSVIHASMLQICEMLAEIGREMVAADPCTINLCKREVVKRLFEVTGHRLTTKSLGHTPYKEAIEDGVIINMADARSLDIRVRKREHEFPMRMLIFKIQRQSQERDALGLQVAAVARVFAEQLTPLD